MANTNMFDVDFVILSEGENNGYDDSDFYYNLYDVKNHTIVKHIHSTTRGYGYNPVEGTVMNYKDCSDEQVEIILDGATKKAINMIEVLGAYVEGDVVEVVKGRKYKKGTTFTAQHSFIYRDRYGRYLTKYLKGVTETGDDIAIDVNNVQLKTRDLNSPQFIKIAKSLISECTSRYLRLDAL